jgi:hypothetical protein
VPTNEAELHAMEIEASERGGVVIVLNDGDNELIEVAVDGRTAAIAMPEIDSLADLRGGLPARARGDQREKVLYNILQDAGGVPRRDRRPEQLLRDSLEAEVSGADVTSRSVLSRVMADQYWVTPGVGSGRASTAAPVVFPVPFQSALPATFDYRGRYKSFRGTLLAFLLWGDGGYDAALMGDLFAFFNDERDLNILDIELLRCARSVAGSAPSAGVANLLALPEVSKLEETLREAGTMFPDALARFREDMRAVLGFNLARYDVVSALVLTFSLHVALYYYRLAVNLGEGISGIAAAAADRAGPPGGGEFDGRLLFRVALSADRPVRVADPCAVSFGALDEQHLLALPASIEVANLLSLIWQAASGTVMAPLDLRVLELAMREDPGLGALVDTACAVLAVAYGARTGSPVQQPQEGPRAPGSGIHGLREVVLDRYRASGLKQRGRDVVHQLIRRPFGGSLIRHRGNVRFFEMDEDFLLLLVRWTVARAGQQQVPLADFLDELRRYGLCPQNDGEIDNLSVVLERLGLLARYSDVGEAQYVRVS